MSEMVDFTWSWYYLLIPVALFITVAWAMFGIWIGILWGATSQRTDSMAVAILTGIFIIVPLGILQETGIIPVLERIQYLVLRGLGVIVRLIVGEPPPPAPEQPPWVPRARPPRPEGDVVFDWDTWTWIPRDQPPLDK